MALMPAADIEVTEPLVRRLLTEQFPDLAGLPLRLAASGWDNSIFRLGSNLTVRLPRREAAAHLIEHEQRWLPPTHPRPDHAHTDPGPVRDAVVVVSLALVRHAVDTRYDGGRAVPFRPDGLGGGTGPVRGRLPAARSR